MCHISILFKKCVTSGEQSSSIVMPIFRIYNFWDRNFSSQLDSLLVAKLWWHILFDSYGSSGAILLPAQTRKSYHFHKQALSLPWVTCHGFEILPESMKSWVHTCFSFQLHKQQWCCKPHLPQAPICTGQTDWNTFIECPLLACISQIQLIVIIHHQLRRGKLSSLIDDATLEDRV